MDAIIETELFLVRHGQSMGNIERTAEMTDEDVYDPMLTEKGRKQAECLGEYFSLISLDAIISSGLNRAVETASEVAKRQEKAGFVQVHPLFSECNIEKDGRIKKFEEIKNKFPRAIIAEGAENENDFILRDEKASDEDNLNRAKQAVSYIRSRFNRGEKVMVVAHAAFNTNILFAALGLTHHEIFDAAYENTGVTKFIFYKPGTGPFGNDVHLIYHNDHSHINSAFPGASLNER